ncbi:CHAT domain-containing protein [Gautieria morchelliformis]|nr:CHAT domain-containing protein [Gautieria morchelliformis]
MDYNRDNPLRVRTLRHLRGRLHHDFLVTLATRLLDSGEQEDLNSAISLYREALQLPAPHPERSASLNDLATALSMRFKQSGRHEDLEEAISLHREALELFPAPHPLRSSSLNNIANVLLTRFEQSGRQEDLEEAISLHREALDLFPAPHPLRSTSLNSIAVALLTRFEQSGRQEDLKEAISLHREALRLRPAPHLLRSSSLHNLATALSTRFGRSGRHKDLEEAISLHREVLELLPAPHPLRPSSLNNIAAALLTRFEQFGRHQDLEEAISLHREALQLRPAPHSERSTSLNNLAKALSTRFKQSGRHEDLKEAISLYREALELLPATHLLRSSSLNDIAAALKTRFEQSGRQEDLEEAISLHRAALQLRPAPHPDRSISLNNLANALWARFDQSGRHEDLEEAISLHREALEVLPATHPLRSSSLNNIGYALLKQFEQSGRQEDLEEAISLNREVLEVLPAPHPDRSASLHSIAYALRTRFEQSGRQEDLEEAISLHREALQLRPAPHLDRSSSLNDIAAALSTRFEQSGRHEDLEEAISLHRKALELRPAPHPDRSTSLNNLAKVLWARFDQSGRYEDLEEEISLHREALQLQPAPHPDRSISLNNLAAALSTRFDRSRRHEDLEKAISLLREALEVLPATHPLRPSSLNNVGTALLKRLEQSGRHEDLEEAISLYREALKLGPRSSSLNNLAIALSTRFEQSGRHEDLEEAILFLQDALGLLATGHPSICEYSLNLGNTFMRAYTHFNDLGDLQRAMDVFRKAVACETAPASRRFRAAREWASHADFSTHDSALDAYQAAIELLPRLAMLSLDLSSRQQALTSFTDGLACAAATCAIQSGEFERAVELLEEGRAVFWSQALQLRTPMTDLREVAPGLEETLRDISHALEQGSLRDVSWDVSDNSQQRMSMEHEAGRLRRLNDKWLATLEEARKLKGFEDFLRPQRISTLLGAAAEGPVVILNASKGGCAALILTSLNGVQHVPLALTFADVTVLVDLMRIATAPGHGDLTHSASIRGHVGGLLQQVLPSTTLQLMRQSWESRDMTRGQTNSDFQVILAVLWQSVVRHVFHSLGLEKSDMPPNLWWCPTGPFTFLPIHAAGMYNAGEPQCVSDYVVSSYTPTITALLGDMPVSDPFKMMVVIEPNTPNQNELPYTIDELQRIESHVPEKDLIKFNSANVKEVLLYLPTISIAHFACHGYQHPENPLESALMLYGGPLKVSKLTKQPTPNVRLAFLGACQTATGDKTLPDEAIHVASTLLFAGFQGVIATMWSICDEDGPKVADAFYKYLYRKKPSTIADMFQPDTREAAQALHVAVDKLRSEGVSFKRWVPFIHMGSIQKTWFRKGTKPIKAQQKGHSSWNDPFIREGSPVEAFTKSKVRPQRVK